MLFFLVVGDYMFCFVRGIFLKLYEKYFIDKVCLVKMVGWFGWLVVWLWIEVNKYVKKLG